MKNRELKAHAGYRSGSCARRFLTVGKSNLSSHRVLKFALTSRASISVPADQKRGSRRSGGNHSDGEYLVRAEIGFAHVVAVSYFGCRPFHANLAHLDDIGAIGDAQRHVGILFDQ